MKRVWMIQNNTLNMYKKSKRWENDLTGATEKHKREKRYVQKSSKFMQKLSIFENSFFSNIVSKNQI